VPQFELRNRGTAAQMQGVVAVSVHGGIPRGWSEGGACPSVTRSLSGGARRGPGVSALSRLVSNGRRGPIPAAAPSYSQNQIFSTSIQPECAALNAGTLYSEEER
jgi:hypothetical protein